MAKILLVEDSDAFRNILWRYLNEDRHDVLLARDGAEALVVLAANHDVDAILLDVNMPRMNGVQLMSRIHRNPELSKLPCVIISAEKDAESVNAVRGSGARAWLAKPISSVQLRAVLARVLKAA